MMTRLINIQHWLDDGRVLASDLEQARAVFGRQLRGRALRSEADLDTAAPR